MKKFLLSASLLMVSAAAFAATDGQTYEPKNGLTCTNLWIFDRVHTGDAFAASPISVAGAARTATTDGKVVYVENSTTNPATIEKYDVFTGEHLGTINLTLNGEAYAGTLCANQIGFDEYGHFFVFPFFDNSKGNIESSHIYLLDVATGALTSAGTLVTDGNLGRVDYCDVIGDLTGKEAGATVLAVTSAADNRNVFNWRLEKGQGGADVEWAPGWAEDGTYAVQATGTYPVDAETGAPQAGFSLGSTVKMVRPSVDGVLDLFYIDGFTTTPNLYDDRANMIESFGDIPAENGVVVPAMGTNGVAEASVGNQNLFIYSEGQYDGDHSCQAVIAAVDEDRSYASTKQLWLVPADGLGKTSDNGTRYHGLDKIALEDDVNGKHAMLLVSFKCTNGVAVYRIAEEGYIVNGGVADNSVAAAASIRVNGDVIAVSEVAESIEVYNVAGQKVAQVENASEIAAPVNGVYVVKAVVAGAPVVAKVIVK